MRFVQPLFQTEPVWQDDEVDKNKKLVSVEPCPYLGLLGDPDVRYGFPSPVNVCFRSRVVASPAIAHQDAYCLSGVHDYCPVFLEEVDQAPSSDAVRVPGIFGLRLSALGFVVLLLLVLVMAGLLAYELSPDMRGWFSSLPLWALWSQAISAIDNSLGIAPAP